MIKNLSGERLKKFAIPFSLASILTVVVFLPASLAHFGRLDDFSFYMYTREDISGVIQWGWSYGRPVTSFIIGNSFGSVNNISDFSILRFLSLVTLVGIIFIMHLAYLKEKRFGILVKVMATVYFISLPGIWVFMTWAQGLPHLIALLFVAISVSCYTDSKLMWMYYAFSALSMFTYQPFSLLIPVILLSRLIKVDSPIWKKDYLRIAGWNMSLLFFNFLSVRFQASPNPRSALSDDLQGKIEWIFSEWVPRVVFPWTLKVNVPIASLSILAFTYFSLKYVSKQGIQKYGALFSTALFPAIPFFLSNENWASSRAVLSSNIAFAILIMSMASSMEFNRHREAGFKILLSLLVSCLLTLSIFQGYGGLVLPQTREWLLVTKQINTRWGEVSEIKTNLAPFEQSSSPIISYDEFGILNSSVESALLGMLLMAKFGTNLSEEKVLIDSERTCQTSKSYVDKQTKTLHLFPITGTKGCA
jgi:hypothetical protein